MKNFVEAYREARAKEWKYMDAKRAGWAEPGKRTRENHAILVPRREAMIRAAAKDGVDICTYCPDYNCRGCIVNEWKEDPDDE